MAEGSSFWSILAFAGVCRVVLVAYGEWQDAHMAVKYTDIDYTVFSDAASLVAEGRSPYERDTYRYSPLLAFILLPNVHAHPSWGKLLFSAADLVTGALLYLLSRMRGAPAATATKYISFGWLFNPFTLPVATRGNADSLIAGLVLVMLYCCLTQRFTATAALYGLLVHLRIYPIIYGLPILLYIRSRGVPTIKGGCGGQDYLRTTEGGCGGQDELRSTKDAGGSQDYLRSLDSPSLRWCKGAQGKVPASQAAPPVCAREQESVPGVHVRPRRTSAWDYLPCASLIKFAAVAAATFLALGFYCWRLYGMSFLNEAFLYHLTRKDPRHNFSMHFYPVYLRYSLHDSSSLVTFARALASSLPQAAVLVVLASAFYRDLALCFFLQTLAFVAFNKVCTAQYFVWYFCLLPPVLLSSPVHRTGRGLASLAAWGISQTHWLFWAYRLEFLGQKVFLNVWMASVVFFTSNVWVICEVMMHQTNRKN